jgi:hypothetical protein
VGCGTLGSELTAELKKIYGEKNFITTLHPALKESEYLKSVTFLVE